MRIDIHHHFGEGDPVGRIIAALEQMEEKFMANFDTFKTLLQGVSEHTNEIAAHVGTIESNVTVVGTNVEKIIELLEAAQQDGMTPEQTTELLGMATNVNESLTTIKGQAAATSEHLKAVGERSDDPLPPPPAPPEPLPEN